MTLTPEERAARIAQIVASCDYTRTVLGLADTRNMLTQGCMVVTGRQQGVRDQERLLGYCVQVRRGRGQFGSDMVFLRHPDGSLVTHENQCFYLMTPVQEALARPLFEHLPEDEEYGGGYSCCDKVHEVGFVVENSASTPMLDTPFGLVITRVED